MTLDSYLQPVLSPRPRLPGCDCDVPCLGFACTSEHHETRIAVPWCCGSWDDLPEACDECWGKEHGDRDE